MNNSNEISLLLIKTFNNSFLILDSLQFLSSNKLIEVVRKVNVIGSFLVILLGFVGHSLIIFVFSQKRFRTNSSNVFLLCLAINDAIFLILHLFQETVRSYKEVFINDKNNQLLFHRFISMLDITEKHDLGCLIVNYFRDVLRFVSSYSLVAFTLQRVCIVCSPLSRRYKSKKSAWLTVLAILIISLMINIWAPFFFEVTNETQTVFCDVKQNWSKEYFEITAIYVFIVTFIPIVLIFSSNSLIIYKLFLSKVKSRETLNKNKISSLMSIKKHNNSICAKSTSSAYRGSSFMSFSGRHLSASQNLNVPSSEFNSLSRKNSDISLSYKLKPFYSSLNQIANQTHVKDSIKSSTRILLFVSLVFIVLNLPYLISWLLFYNYMTINQISITTKDRMFAALQVSEILYVLNYSILFYVYCASGSKFRNQLKYSGKQTSY